METSFSTPSFGTFLSRVLVPVGGFFAFCFIASGFFFNSVGLQPIDRIPANLENGSAAMNPLSASLTISTKTLRTWLNVPEVCWPGNAVNEHQLKQCNIFWNRLFTATAVTLVPVAATLILLLLLYDNLNNFYRKMRKRVGKGKALNLGVVTNPALTAGDSFSWFYALRTISVQLPTKQQVTVCIPLDHPVPIPGQTLAIFDAGRVFGGKRYFGVLYAPHLLVVSGTAS